MSTLNARPNHSQPLAVAMPLFPSRTRTLERYGSTQTEEAYERFTRGSDAWFV